MTGALAIVLAGVAAGLFVGGAPNPLIMRLGTDPCRHAVQPPDAWLTRSTEAPEAVALLPRSTPLRLLLAAVAGAAAGAAVVPPGGVIIGALVPPAGLLIWSRRRSRTARRVRENDVTDACLALAGQLRAGSPPEPAIHTLAQEWPDLFGPAAGRVAVGGDPAKALRSVAARPGAEPLAAIAAAWEVSTYSGAPLASTLMVVADSLRDQMAVQHEAEAQLATVRTTSRLLAALPAVTLLLFSTGGGTPVDFLLRNPYGVACLAGALIFIGAGLGWVEWTSRAVLRTPWGS